MVPLLAGVQKEDLRGPLSQFQAARAASAADVRKLVESLNRASETPLARDVLEDSFEKRYNDEFRRPLLEMTLGPIDHPTNRSASDLLAEVLDLVRNQQRVLNNPAELLPADYLQGAVSALGQVPRSEGERVTEEFGEVAALVAHQYAETLRWTAEAGSQRQAGQWIEQSSTCDCWVTRCGTCSTLSPILLVLLISS